MKRVVWLGLFVCITLIPVLTTARIILLQKNSVRTLAIASDTNIYRERGPIFDRKGNILAMQVNSWNVGLRLIDTESPESVIILLSKILDIPKDTIRNKLSDPSKYVRIKKLISRKEYNAIMNNKKNGNLSGVQINEISWRKYPGKDSIAPVIGYYGENGSGLDGAEASMNQYLTPQNSKLGNSVYLTIDSVLQNSIEQIVKETLTESKSMYISTILMDARTGEILSMVSEPSFDLNRYYTYTQKTLNNKVIQYNYEPGSVFKVFSIASLLDSKSITPYSTFDATKPYTDAKYGFTIQDIWYPGIINTFQIIKYSSNVGISHAISHINRDLYYQYLRKFGFGSRTGIDLPGESYGIFYPPERWSARSKPTIALGQEIAVTAIQIITATTALANKGLLLKPQIIKKIVSPNGNILFETTPSIQRRVISAKTAHTVLEMMQTTTEPGGTAHRLKINGVNISAKTGTAQVFDVKQHIYSKDNFIASTLSVVPTEDPRIIIYAAIHNPKSGEIYGGRTTAPMIRKMLEFILPYLGLAGKVYTENAQANYTQNKPNIPKSITGSTYEDYRGLRKREIWPLFINTDIHITMKGQGTVVKQSPPAGTAIDENNNLILYLK